MIHKPVLLEPIIQFAPKQTKSILDLTIGRAGHTLGLLKQFSNVHLTGIDRDKTAIQEVATILERYTHQIQLFHFKFSDALLFLEKNQKKFDYIIADLGVSSPQLDEKERGFSFRLSAPLDMRMNLQDSLTAKKIVNEFDETELIQILHKYGEERFAKKIVFNILKKRINKTIETTTELADLIFQSIPRKFHIPGKHPATKTFQALRIRVNQEIEELKTVLQNSLSLLNLKGRLSIISFHSLEDRLVKQCFKKWESPCICPKDIPVCICKKKSLAKRITKKPIIPTQQEINENHRARSAKLRIVEKL